MHFNTRLALCGLLLLTGCSWFESKPAITPEIKAEQDKAGKTYIACLRTQAKALDDHTSPVSTVAAAVVKACAQEYHNFVVTSEKGMSADNIPDYEAKMNNPGHPLSVAIDAVQYQRPLQPTPPAPPQAAQ